jgi:hypothetical protein
LLQPDKILIHENSFLLTDKAHRDLTLYGTSRAHCVYESATEASEKLNNPPLKNNFLFLFLDGLGPLAVNKTEINGRGNPLR